MNATRKSSLGLKMNVRFGSRKARSNLTVQIPHNGEEDLVVLRSNLEPKKVETYSFSTCRHFSIYL